MKFDKNNFDNSDFDYSKYGVYRHSSSIYGIFDITYNLDIFKQTCENLELYEDEQKVVDLIKSWVHDIKDLLNTEEIKAY